MWDQFALALDQRRCFVASVSSFLIMLVLQPLLENAVAANRAVLSAWGATIRLLARDDSVVDVADDEDDDGHRSAVPPRRRCCEQCAQRGTSFADVAAVVRSLGLAAPDEEGEDDVFGTGIWAETGGQGACGGCAAMAVVDELRDTKVASEAELREAFYVFDRDEDGFVTPAELWNVMRRLGLPEGARYEDCRRMVAAYDGDGDGRVSFREFRAMMENAV